MWHNNQILHVVKVSPGAIARSEHSPVHCRRLPFQTLAVFVSAASEVAG